MEKEQRKYRYKTDNLKAKLMSSPFGKIAIARFVQKKNESEVSYLELSKLTGIPKTSFSKYTNGELLFLDEEYEKIEHALHTSNGYLHPLRLIQIDSNFELEMLDGFLTRSAFNDYLSNLGVNVSTREKFLELAEKHHKELLDLINEV